jgi:pimeloyl-ACP methyl ester carboxylesterase
MKRALGIEYEEYGQGEPLLLIHGGFICDALSLVAQEPALADRYRVIWYRRRGYAGSEPAPGEFSIESQAKDAEDLLAHLGVEQAHVVGHSGGGVIATQLALQAPHLVRTLVLNEPAIFPPALATEFPKLMAPAFQATEAGELPAAVDHFMSIVTPGIDWRKELEAAFPGGPKQADENARFVFEVELVRFADWAFDADKGARLQAPLAYICGGDSGPMVEGLRDHFLSLAPQAVAIDLPGVDHSMNTQDPKLVADAIAAFLAKQA